MTIHSFGMVCPIIVGLIILFWDRTIPSISWMLGIFRAPCHVRARLAVSSSGSPASSPLKLDTSRTAPEEMGVDGQMHDLLLVRG